MNPKRLVPAFLFLALHAHAMPLASFMRPRAPAPEIVVVTRVGDQEVKLQFFRPNSVPEGEPRPGIIWIHGGAWVGGTTEGTTPHARYFAERGMFSANIVYRLASPGKVTVADCLVDCLADCRSAMTYLREHAVELGIDPARNAVAGDSAGGHLAAASQAAGNRCDLVIYEDNIGHAFVLAGYRWPEPVVVEAVRAGDRFLVSLGWLKGEPSLTISDPPAWPARKP